MEIDGYMRWCNHKYTHFIGIGGAGMSAIAAVLLDMGCKVSGSDLKLNGLAKRLSDKGAIISEGHNGFNIKNTGIVVVSSAIPDDNPELREAKKAGVPVIQRAEMLNIIMKNKKGIVISGSHGKTTTTSMISLILEKAGIDPTVLIGGELNDIGGNAKLGKGEYLVAEADESDGSFLKLYPYMAVITNIEDDHLDYYKNLENIKKAFKKFTSQVSNEGGIVVCKDNINLMEITRDYKGKVLTYGVRNKGDVYAEVDFLDEFSSISSIYLSDDHLGTLKLNVPGLHNVYNALAAIAVGINLGLEFEKMAQILEGFKGASRRFQVLYKDNDFLVIDDYAHHPTEVKATIEAARNGWQGKRIISIFQPHRYTRTFYLHKKFAQAFDNSNLVFLTGIYSAGEKPMPGVSSQLIYDEMLKNGYKNVRYIPQKKDLPEILLDIIEPGDILLFMGAGDICDEGKKVASLLREEIFTA